MNRNKRLLADSFILLVDAFIVKTFNLWNCAEDRIMFLCLMK